MAEEGNQKNHVEHVVDNNKEEKDDESSLFQEIGRDVQCLSDHNKMTRRRTLEKLYKQILQKSSDKESFEKAFSYVYKPCLKLFNDPIDRTRELAVKLIIECCALTDDSSKYLPYVVPTIHQRLANDDTNEPTEEIRLLLIEGLSKLTDSTKNIGIYINELTQILQRTIVDPFAEVRKASCICVCKLASVSPERFYQQGESLIPALLKSLSHQHNKVRAAVLKTIGVVVLATSGKAIDDVFTHIAQRTFDHSGPVRMMVTEVAGRWLLELRDRYSFFHKLLPLLLSGLEDHELPEVSLKSLDYFHKAGKQYEEENEDEFKEKNLYIVGEKFDYLLGGGRSSIGCRVLVQRNFSKILPAIVHDITDWNVSTRIKSASLLYTLVYHCEDQVTMHMELLSQGIYRAAQDEEKKVVAEVIRVAGLIGMFVEPSVYCKLILPHLENVATNSSALSGGLAILAAYIQNSEYEALAPEIPKICKTLELPNLSCCIHADCQFHLYRCVQELIHQLEIKKSEVHGTLFKILVNILSLAGTQDIQQKIYDLLDTMSRFLYVDDSNSDRYYLFDCYGNNILESLLPSAKFWTSQSPECSLFMSLLSESGRCVSSLLPSAVPIFLHCCDTTKDSEMRQKMFMMMSQVVMTSCVEEEFIQKYRQYVIKIVKEAILPNCVWQAGRTAAAIRSTAVSLLWALLQATIIADDQFQEIYKEIQTHLVACLDDFNETTRSVTVKVLLKMLQVCTKSMTVEQLHVLYPDLLKRMDDSSNEIRILTCKVFSAYFHALPDDYNRDFYREHIKYIYESLLIHLDDPNENIQTAVLSCLSDGARIHPALMSNEIDEVMLKHRSKQLCEELKKICLGQK